MKTLIWILVALTSLQLLVGCVERSRELTSAERERLRPYVSRQAPNPQHRLDISFEDKIRLVGYDISATSWRPGEEVSVTWYWKCERPLEDGWRLFTHVADAQGGSRHNADNTGPLREAGLYQPGRWRAGEYIKDEQRIRLPNDWNSPEASLRIGLWHGPDRLRITAGAAEHRDADNRAKAVTLTVTGAAAAPVPTVPQIAAPRATGPVTIDGRLEEWSNAATTPELVNTMDGSAAEPHATTKVMWDDENLYVAFDVRDALLRSSFTRHDDHLWQQDAVEIMVDPDGDGRNYFEMQVSPQGVVFDTRYDTARQPQPFGHVDWSSNLRAQVVRQGTSNDDEADQGYVAEIAIPWAAFTAATPPGTAGTKPNVGDSWRVNFFVMDSTADGQRAVGWSPPRVGDFHTLARFGRVRFGTDTSTRDVAVPAVGPAAPKMALPPGVIQQLQRQLSERAGVGRVEQQNRPQRGEPVPTAERPRPTESAAPAPH